MKKTHYLLRFLAVIFGISEFIIAIGIASTFFLFPYATRMVEQRSGNFAVFVTNGTQSPGFNFTWGKSGGFSWGSGEDQDAMRPGFRYPRSQDHSSFGRVTFGRFRTDENALPFKMASADGTVAVLDYLEGSFTFTAGSPADATAILAPIKWPFILSFVCTGSATIAILELLRRMFRKIATGEVFTRTSIRYAQAIGFLFIVSSLLKGMTAGWLKHAMAVVVMKHLVTGAVVLDSSAKGDSSGFVTGLVILALTEVFRQGLILKEESALTI